MIINSIIRWIHLLAATTWVGGMIFHLFIAFPALTTPQQGQRVTVNATILSRFLKVVWVSVGVLILTGIWNLNVRIHQAVPPDFSWWVAFLIKFLLVLGMISMSGKLHFAIVPKLKEIATPPSTASGGEGGETELATLQKKAMGLTRGTLLLGIVVLLLAAYLTLLSSG
ncbi:MAG: hypothetical protein D6736_13285 [Nitrospinota bacterium]|nr:MAG: hypothetical protein D6736_13285 [Nitrospinota bacterium]